MSKLIPFALAGVGATASSVGGVYLIKGTSSKPKEDKIPSDLGFTNHDTFKSSKENFCAKKYFGNIDYKTEVSTPLSSTAQVDSNYFPGTGDNEDVKSCLVINWERTDSTEAGGKGKGHFKWLGALVKGNKGFVTFNHYKPSSTENKMKLEGGIYFLEKDGNKQTWSVKKHKELQNSNEIEIDSAKFGETFPDKGESIDYDFTASGEDKKEQWGFTKSGGDLDNICKTGDGSNCPATGGKPKSFKGSWIWKPNASEDKTIDKGGKDSVSKLLKIYDSCFNGTNPFDSIKGTGTLENDIKIS